MLKNKKIRHMELRLGKVCAGDVQQKEKMGEKRKKKTTDPTFRQRGLPTSLNP
jgi:hypothetical protein